MTEQSRSNRINRASNDVLEATSFLSAANAPYIEALYAQWLESPESLEPSWAAWFAELGSTGIAPARERFAQFTAPPSKQDAELLGFLLGSAHSGVGVLDHLGVALVVPFAKTDQVHLQPLDENRRQVRVELPA